METEIIETETEILEAPEVPAKPVIPNLRTYNEFLSRLEENFASDDRANSELLLRDAKHARMEGSMTMAQFKKLKSRFRARFER